VNPSPRAVVFSAAHPLEAEVAGQLGLSRRPEIEDARGSEQELDDVVAYLLTLK